MVGDFTVTFYIGRNSTAGQYRSFIKELRSRLGVGYYQNRPILAREERRPNIWFDVMLQTDNHQTRFRFRRDNVYLVGYQMEGSNQWLEFTDENRHPQQLIAGSSTLYFGGGYTALTRAGGRYLEDVQVSRADLASAVDDLATTTIQRDRAQSLTVVIIMLSEAIRNLSISDFVASNYNNSSRLSSQLRLQINGWGNLSERLLVAHDRPDHLFQIPGNDMGIVNIEQAVDVMGMLKDCRFSAVSGRHPRQTAATHSGGQPLVEVFSVRINYTDGSDLYGRITISDGLSKSIVIYNRGKEDYEPVGQGENCTLAGPQSRCISAADDFTINLDLWNYHKVFADHQVSHGQISWNVYDTAVNKYDTLLSTTVGGGVNGGSATVKYIVLRNGLQATVEVVLMKSGEASYAWVYGVVGFTDGHSSDERILFQRKWSDHMEVNVGEKIGLLRSVMAVPINSSLIVRATLNDYNRFSPDYEIANGSEDFTARYSSDVVKYIDGRNGHIRVKVTWTDM